MSSQHGIPVRTYSFDRVTVLQDKGDGDLKEDLYSCNQFLVDSEIEKGRPCVFNFATSSFNSSFVNEKLDHVFNQLKFLSKSNLRSDLY